MSHSVSDREYRKARRDLNLAIKEWNELVSSGEFSKEDLRVRKEAVDKSFLVFSSANKILAESKVDDDDVEELNESLEMFIQIYQSIGREFNTKTAGAVILTVLQFQDEILFFTIIALV